MDRNKITKEYAIAEFKKWCNDYTKNEREEAVCTHSYRVYWELNISGIMFRISNAKAYDDNSYCLWVFESWGSVLWNNKNVNVIAKFKLSKEEYLDLKKHYFINISIDTYYMKRIDSLTYQWNNIKKQDAEIL